MQKRGVGVSQTRTQCELKGALVCPCFVLTMMKYKDSMKRKEGKWEKVEEK